MIKRASARDRKLITCRWVFAVKRNKPGAVKRFKARNVINGFKQKGGTDYLNTYAPVILFETLRVAIYCALKSGWANLQFGVMTAFLYGDLKDDIFTEHPPGLQSWATSMCADYTRVSTN